MMKIGDKNFVCGIGNIRTIYCTNKVSEVEAIQYEGWLNLQLIAFVDVKV